MLLSFVLSFVYLDSLLFSSRLIHSLADCLDAEKKVIFIKQSSKQTWNLYLAQARHKDGNLVLPSRVVSCRLVASCKWLARPHSPLPLSRLSSSLSSKDATLKGQKISLLNNFKLAKFSLTFCDRSFKQQGDLLCWLNVETEAQEQIIIDIEQIVFSFCRVETSRWARYAVAKKKNEWRRSFPSARCLPKSTTTTQSEHECLSWKCKCFFHSKINKQDALM